VAFGIDPSTVRTNAIRVENDCLIWPENWPTVEVFLSLSSQWNVFIPALGGGVVWRGIPHSEVEPTIRMLGFGHDIRTIFIGIKVMEGIAIDELKRSSNNR